MRCIIFVVDQESSSGSAAELQAIDSFNDYLIASGKFIQAIGIAGPNQAVTIDNRASAGKVEQKSLNCETYYSGLWLIQAADWDEALDLAQQASKACNRVVELRPLLGG